MNNASIRKLFSESDISKINGARKPLIAIYRVAHEGVSNGAILGMGVTAKNWSGEKIGELAEKLSGAPVFVEHRIGGGLRMPVGYVLRAKKIIGKNGAEAIALVAIDDPKTKREVEAKMLDTASVEADIVIEAGEKEWNVEAVEAVTGLALANAAQHRPGFKRAQLLETAIDVGGEDGTQNPRENSAAISDVAHLAKLNLSAPELDFVRKRIEERIQDAEPDDAAVQNEIDLALRALDEAKKIYRKPPARVSIPFDIRRGAIDYANPDYNEFIPKARR